MNTFYKNAKKTLLKPLVITSLVLAPMLYSGCNSDCKEVTRDSYSDSVLVHNTIEQFVETMPGSSPEHPMYVITSEAPVKVNGDTVWKDGMMIVNATIADYIRSGEYFQNNVLGIDDETLDAFQENDSLENLSNTNNTTYYPTSNNWNNNSNSTYNNGYNNSIYENIIDTVALDSSVLGSMGNYVETNNTNADCNTNNCLTSEQLIFNAVNEKYKNK